MPFAAQLSLPFATHAAVWISALCGIISPQLTGFARTLALLSAGVWAVIAVLGEWLRAARASQNDTLSAFYACWLNSLALPLTSAGITTALEMPAWAIALILVATCTLYNAKVVLYYRATVLQLPGNTGYFPKLGHWRREHFAYCSLCSVLAVLYVTGAIHLHHFLLCSVFTSFRISGTYALRAFSQVGWNGIDRWLISIVIAMAITHVLSITHSPAHVIDAITASKHWLAAGICCYAVIANLSDFSRHYPSLRLNAESAH
jgi:hypothetical protein